MSGNYSVEQVMQENGAERLTAVPRSYSYVTILNSTGWVVRLYKGSTIHVSNLMGQAPIYSNVTIPLPAHDGVFTLEWTGGSVEEKTRVIFSEINLGINQTLIPPGGSSSMILTAETVGLARGNQFPAALTLAGNLKVAIQEAMALTLAAAELKPATAPEIFAPVAAGGSQALPANTRRFTVRAVGGDIQVGYALAGPWLTIPDGGTYPESDLKATGLSIFVDAGSVGSAEIVAWT